MARIYQPRRRADDQRWEMTVGSDEEGWCHPTGYCAGTFAKLYPEQRSEAIRAMMPGEAHEAAYQAERQKAEKFAARFHDYGHATADEAQECYDRFLVEMMRRTMQERDVQRRCYVCGEWTQNRVDMLYEMLIVCDTHNTPEGIAAARQTMRERGQRGERPRSPIG